MPPPTSIVGEQQAVKELAEIQDSDSQYKEPLWRDDDDIADLMEVQQPWAERKRIEMDHDVSSETSPDQMCSNVPLTQSAEASSCQGKDGQRDLQPKETGLEDLVDGEEQNRLLASWLEDADHPEESWAERVLGKEGTSQEN